MTPETDSTSAIQTIVGPDAVRRADHSDSIAGVRPRSVVEPASYEQVSEILLHANATGLKVIPRGGRTKLDWGNPPERVDTVLSTQRLNKVREHAWGDLTATVEAGCTVANFQRVLAKHGQRLAIDPLFPDHATIGGILATNDSGSMRLRFGALRDLIIGISVALPDGTIAKSGGKVVKNVAGYDLAKLFTGSLGTLGVILDATFRLYPLPVQAQTITFELPTIAAANELVLAILASTLTPGGLQIRTATCNSVRVDAILEGTAEVIEEQVNRFCELAGGPSPVKQSEPENARAELFSGADSAVIAKCSLTPSQIARVCEFVARHAAENNLDWQAVIQATGIGLLRLNGPPAQTRDAATQLRAYLATLDGSLVILRQPAPASGCIEVWGDAGTSLPLMRRIKSRFDPNSILNPGRFVGGI